MKEFERAVPKVVVPELSGTITWRNPVGKPENELTLPFPEAKHKDKTHGGYEVRDGKVASVKRRQMRREHPSGKQQRRK